MKAAESTAINETDTSASDSTRGDYVKDRVLDQYEWHNNKASSNRKRFYITETIALVVGALIPVVNVIPVVIPTGRPETSCPGSVISPL